MLMPSESLSPVTPKPATMTHASMSGLLALLVACGGQAAAPERGTVDQSTEGTPTEPSRAPVGDASNRAADGERPPSVGSAGPGNEEDPRSIPEQPPAVLVPTPTPAVMSNVTRTDCVALPSIEPRAPQIDLAQSCAIPDLATIPASVSSEEDARPFLVGRWELCGADTAFGQSEHSGLEFGSNGRVQLLHREGDALSAAPNGPSGTFTLLPTGQFMMNGALSLDEYAVFVRFDPGFDALEIDAFGTTLRYARVIADVASAAANSFATANASCSMVGVWDTIATSENPAAAFAFDAEGEWIGGERGSDLCSAHSMYGTYELTADQFNLVTNVGAGLCSFWFDASFGATFSEDCNQLTLRSSGDNCTGGRGYLNWPGEVLIRRQP
jgi:hypothetical protein